MNEKRSLRKDGRRNWMGQDEVKEVINKKYNHEGKNERKEKRN
jgi:hypothetical protein